MRISCDSTDPGFEAYIQHREAGVRIYCDGRELDAVITADDQAGYVLVLNLDAAGNAKLCEEGFDTRIIRGAVRIVTGQGYAPDRAKPPIDFLELNREFSSR